MIGRGDVDAHSPGLSGSALARERRLALGLGLLIALYGNGFAIVDALTQISLGGTLGGGLLGLAALAGALRRGPRGLSECGVLRRRLASSLSWGALLGLGMGLPGLLYFLRPDLAPVAVQHEAVLSMTPLVFGSVVLIKIPFFTALAEELAFRGVLQARLRAAFGPRTAIVLGSLIFTAWHLVVSFTTLRGTGLVADPMLAGLTYLGQNLAVLVAGLLFGLLRERGGNLWGCVLAHWLVSVLLVGGLYFGAQR